MTDTRPRRLGPWLIIIGVLLAGARLAGLQVHPSLLSGVLGCLTLVLLFLPYLPLSRKLFSLGLALLCCFSLAQTGGIMLSLSTAAMMCLLAYSHQLAHWWYLILAGGLAGGATRVYLARYAPDWDGITSFCLVLALSFSLLYLFPKVWGGRRWALLPAVMLLCLTLILNDSNLRSSPVVATFFCSLGLMIIAIVRQRQHMQSTSHDGNP